MRRLAAGAWLAMLFVACASAQVQNATAWITKAAGWGEPTAAQGLVFALTKAHEVLAIDENTGVLRWRVRTEETGVTTQGTRVIARHGVVVAADYDLHGFDAATGRHRWTFRPESGHAPGMQLGDDAGGVSFAGSGSGHMFAIDILTGSPRWTTRVTDSTALSTVYAPGVHADRVVAGFTSFGGGQNGGIACVDAATGRLLWTYSFGPQVAFGGGPVFDGRQVMAATDRGEILALDLERGTLNWSLPSRNSFSNLSIAIRDFMALAVHGRVLVAGSTTGQLAAYDLDARTELWRSSDPRYGSVTARIAILEGVLMVPFHSGRLVAMDPRSGRELWRTDGYGRGFFWLPVLAGGRWVATADGVGVVAWSRP